MLSPEQTKKLALEYLNPSNDTLEKAKTISVLLLDVDGVLSDGRISFDNQGLESKSFNTKDGQGIKLLQKTGVAVGIITGRKSQIVEKRAAELGIEFLIQGREDKYDALNEFSTAKGWALNDIAFMGDDYPDLTIMTKVGLALSVSDGHFAVKSLADWVSPREGGRGAVRDACDLIMVAQDTFHSSLTRHF